MEKDKKGDISLKEHFDTRFDEMERRFDENTKEHEAIRKEYRFVNKNLGDLKQEVFSNTNFRYSYQPVIDKLANDRERKVKKILDIVFIFVVIAVIIILGMDSHSSLINLFV